MWVLTVFHAPYSPPKTSRLRRIARRNMFMPFSWRVGRLWTAVFSGAPSWSKEGTIMRWYPTQQMTYEQQNISFLSKLERNFASVLMQKTFSRINGMNMDARNWAGRVLAVPRRWRWASDWTVRVWQLEIWRGGFPCRGFQRIGKTHVSCVSLCWWFCQVDCARSQFKPPFV